LGPASFSQPPRHQIFHLNSVAVFEGLGDPAAVTVLMIALIAEDADRPGLFNERREFVDFLAGLRRFQMRCVDVVQHIELAAAPGQPALLRRPKPAQVQVGNAAVVEARGEMVL
jgi:hypothetical protein